MSSSMNTILIVGATSGLGEGFTRRFHALGKKIIITGRRQDRLAALQKELPGLETRQLDVTDFAALPSQVSEITTLFPNIDTVFLNAGIMSSFSFADPTTSTPTAIATEVATNLTAPLLLTRLLLPHLLALKKPASLLFTSSAAIHSFCVTLRQQLDRLPKNQVSVIEIVPPYVDTALDASFRDRLNEMMGGHSRPPMPLEEYLDVTMTAFEEAETKNLKEVATGFAEKGVSTWRGSFGKVFEGMGIDV